jgi:arylsulfatase A-like enzyme
MAGLTRGYFLKAAVIGIAAVSILGCGRLMTVDRSQRSSQPNILFIVVDGLNDCTGCLGGKPQAKTPNIDSLAKRGTLFTNAYCAACGSLNSRLIVLTGLWAGEDGEKSYRWANAITYWRTQSPVLKKVLTIPEYFKANGYEVIGSGKIFSGNLWKNENGWYRNQNDFTIWDSYFPPKAKSVLDFFLPSAVVDNNGTVSWQPAPNGPKHLVHPSDFDWAAIDYPDSRTADYKIVSWTIDELRKNHKKPFFLAVGLSASEVSWFIPKEYFEMYPLDHVQLPPIVQNDINDIPPGVREFVPDESYKQIVKNNLLKNAVQAYLAGTTYIDAQVGRLIDALDKSRYAENTIIVLLSDRGFLLGQKEHWGDAALWGKSTHVPLIIIAPSAGKPYSRCSRAVSLIDIYPTLIDLCKMKPQANLAGESLVPLLSNPQAHRETPAITICGDIIHSVRTERWSYIKYRDGSEELYDHQADPCEFTNLAGRPEYDHIKLELFAWIPENK